jgi:hypothetical protein
VNRKLIVLTVAIAALLSACGCSRHVPLTDLSAGGAVVGVIATTVDGEEIRGELVSVTEREMVVLARYTQSEAVEIEGFGEGRRVIVDGVRVDGEVVSVDRVEGARVARVRRTLRVVDVARATFHRSGQEASLGTLLSFILGPSVGGLLALAI